MMRDWRLMIFFRYVFYCASFAAALNTVAVYAQTPAKTTHPGLLNRSFEDVSNADTTQPKDWKLDGDAYDYTLDKNNVHKGIHSLRVGYKAGAPYAGTIQTIAATAWSGKAITLSAYIKRGDAQGKVGIWLSAVDSDKKRLTYLNTYEEPYAQNTMGWVKHSITLVLPPNTYKLLIGAAAYGEADTRMWVDDFDIELA
jgi:hypothetical protein